MAKKYFLIGLLSLCHLVGNAMDSAVEIIGDASGTSIPQAVVVDRARWPLLHTTQLLPVDAEGKVRAPGDVAGQLEGLISDLISLLDGSTDVTNVVKLNIYVAQAEALPVVQKELLKQCKARFKANPAVTFLVSALPQPEALVALDAVMIKAGLAGETVKRIAATGSNFARAAVLPTNGVVYISGQADKGELAEATRKTLEKLEASLKFMGLGKEDVVQCKAFIHPSSDAAVAKKEFEKFFAGQVVPPLVFVDWVSKDLPIEIETIAAARAGTKATEQIEYLTPPDVTASPVYAKIVRVNRGKMVYFSGLTGKSANQAEDEIKEIFAELEAVAKKAKSDITHLAKATYYCSTSQTSGKLNELRPKYFNPKRPPAASKAMVKNIGMPGKGMLIDMIGVTAE